MLVSILLAYNQLTVVLVSNNNQIPIDPVRNTFREKYRCIKTFSVSNNVFNETLFLLVKKAYSRQNRV